MPPFFSTCFPSPPPQTLPVVLLDPSSSPTVTPSQTPSASQTPSNSPTATTTTTQTASLSPGAAPSSTPSGSITATPSVTPTGSLTASPTATTTPLVPFPDRVRIQMNASVICNFMELIVIGTNGRVLSHPMNGAVATSSSVWSATVGAAINAADLVIDPLTTNTSQLVHTVGVNATDFVQVRFPPQPAGIARVMLVNRGDPSNVFNQRIQQGGGQLVVQANNGTRLFSAPVSGNWVQVWDFAPLPASSSPNAGAPSQSVDVETKARYRVITTSGGAFFSFREVQLLSSQLDILTHGKPATVTDNGHGADSAESGTNGKFSYDVPSLIRNDTNDLVILNASGMAAGEGAVYQLDLGGLYAQDELNGIWLWANRFRAPSVPISVELWNTNGMRIFNFTVRTAPSGAQYINIARSGGFYAGSATPSASGSPSNSRSPSQTPSNTRSSTASLTNTPSNTPSPSVTLSTSSSRTATLSGGATPSATASPMSEHPTSVSVRMGNVCMNFVELLAFNTQGRLISAARDGASFSLSVPTHSNPLLNASNGNDGCLEVSGSTGAVLPPCGLLHSVCNASALMPAPFTDSVYTITFPPLLPSFPTGEAQPVGSVYFINRMDGGFGSRIVAGGGRLTLDRADGSQVGPSLALLSGSVTQWQVNNITLPPILAEGTWSESDKMLRVRYVTITSVGNLLLSFREFMLLDEAGVNVALRKPVSGSPQDASGSLASGNDGVIDTDIAPLNQVSSATGNGNWTVDLQAST